MVSNHLSREPFSTGITGGFLYVDSVNMTTQMEEKCDIM